MSRRGTYRTIARHRYPQALWIAGEGPYASLAYCGGLTVLLCASQEAAMQAKQGIDHLGCGHACRGEHRGGLHVVEDLTPPHADIEQIEQIVASCRQAGFPLQLVTNGQGGGAIVSTAALPPDLLGEVQRFARDITTFLMAQETLR